MPEIFVANIFFQNTISNVNVKSVENQKKTTKTSEMLRKYNNYKLNFDLPFE